VTTLSTHAHQRPDWVKGKGNRGYGGPQQSSSSDRSDICLFHLSAGAGRGDW